MYISSFSTPASVPSASISGCCTRLTYDTFSAHSVKGIRNEAEADINTETETVEYEVQNFWPLSMIETNLLMFERKSDCQDIRGALRISTARNSLIDNKDGNPEKVFRSSVVDRRQKPEGWNQNSSSSSSSEAKFRMVPIILIIKQIVRPVIVLIGLEGANALSRAQESTTEPE
ncbi:hypothetical protein RUM43_000550 [Polyplax serrata]|uniref:Uncharacterized protein n=1 Tax=Polyplax serrata TaxID=468196 RepID=A0AAN8SCL7_POLSC